MTQFNKWFATFLNEKDLPFASWTLQDGEGRDHMIDSDVVIEAVKNAPEREQKMIKIMIVKIDFANGDTNDYFRHLGQALVNNY
jgi:hypothetical protein